MRASASLQHQCFCMICFFRRVLQSYYSTVLILVHLLPIWMLSPNPHSFCWTILTFAFLLVWSSQIVIPFLDASLCGYVVVSLMCLHMCQENQYPQKSLTCAPVFFFQEIHNKVRPYEIELIRRDYFANGGWETFLSYEDVEQVLFKWTYY